jgi:hypothetical protein
LHLAITPGVVAPPLVEKPVQQPAKPPKEKRPDEPAPIKAEPVAKEDAPPVAAANPNPAQPAAVQKAAEGVEDGDDMKWLPVVIFAGVTVPIFLLLFLTLDNKKQTVECVPFEARRAKALPDVPVATAATSSTGICSRPGGVLPRGRQLSVEGLVDVPELKLADWSAATIEQAEETPQRATSQPTAPLEWPWWVIVGLWKIPNRQVAWLFFWISLLLAVVPGLVFGLFENYLFYTATFIAPAFWYWMCIRWADEHDVWDQLS